MGLFNVCQKFFMIKIVHADCRYGKAHRQPGSQSLYVCENRSTPANVLYLDIAIAY